MRHVARAVVVTGSVLVLLAPGAPSATAATTLATCQKGIAKARLDFVSRLLRLEQRCRHANVRFHANTCLPPLAEGPTAAAMLRQRAHLERRLQATLTRRCDDGFFPCARMSAAVFCLGGTGSPAIDTLFGLPGPAAITQSETLRTTGF